MENNEKHIHSFKNTVVPSNCKENGYTLHKCECGYEHKDNFTPKGSHNFELSEEKNPTCIENGYRKLHCTVCDEIVEETIPPLGHDWGEMNVEIFPTCSEDGKGFHTCKRCGFEEEQVIKSSGHKLTSPKKSQTEKGMIEYFCENCGETVVMPTKAKKFSNYVKSHKKGIIASFAGLLCLIAIIVAGIIYLPAVYHYNYGKKLIADGDYKKAYQHLYSCRYFKDTKDILDNFIIINTVYTHSYESFGEHNYSFKTKTTYEFDEYGNITLCNYISYYGEDNEVDSRKYVYEYDDNGNVIKVTQYNDGGNKIGETEHKCDNDGNVTYSFYSSFDEESYYESEIFYEYDENDKETYYKYIRYTDGKISFEHERKMSDDGEAAYETEIEYDENGAVKSKEESNYEYKYNKFDDIIEMREYNEDGVMIYEYIVDYDIKGKILGATDKYYDNDGELIYEGIEIYDEYGVCIRYEMIGYDNGEVSDKSENEYSDFVYFYNEK